MTPVVAPQAPRPLLEFVPAKPQIDTARNKAVTVGGFYLHDRKRGRVIYCHDGFSSDGASIPWFVQWRLSKTCLGEKGPQIHDLLYQSGGGRHTWACVVEGDPYSRSEADDLLIDLAALEEGTEPHELGLARKGLGLAGWWSWKSKPKRAA